MSPVFSFLQRLEALKIDTLFASVATYKQAEASLLDHFAPNRDIESITKADARAFRSWLEIEGNRRDTKQKRKTLAENTVRRRIGLCRQMFKFAIESEWLHSNPFKGIPASVHANPERFDFVPTEDAETLIDKAPDATMRAIIALNRFLGFRIPSEIRTLTWADVHLGDDDGHDVVDVAAWVGNSPAIIWGFYAMAKSENRRRAAAKSTRKICGPKAGGSKGNQQPARIQPPTKKPAKRGLELAGAASENGR